VACENSANQGMCPLGVIARTEDRADCPVAAGGTGRRVPRVYSGPQDDGLAAVRQPTSYVGRRRLYNTLAGKSVGPSLRRAITLPAPGGSLARL
jgi:hypothetical protein